MSDGHKRADPLATKKLLRCSSCGNILPCTENELFAYIQQGWPKCCRETMTLFVEVSRTTLSNDTPDEK